MKCRFGLISIISGVAYASIGVFAVTSAIIAANVKPAHAEVVGGAALINVALVGAAQIKPEVSWEGDELINETLRNFLKLNDHDVNQGKIVMTKSGTDDLLVVSTQGKKFQIEKNQDERNDYMRISEIYNGTKNIIAKRGTEDLLLI